MPEIQSLLSPFRNPVIEPEFCIKCAVDWGWFKIQRESGLILLCKLQ